MTEGCPVAAMIRMASRRAVFPMLFLPVIRLIRRGMNAMDLNSMKFLMVISWNIGKRFVR